MLIKYFHTNYDIIELHAKTIEDAFFLGEIWMKMDENNIDVKPSIISDDVYLTIKLQKKEK